MKKHSTEEVIEKGKNLYGDKYTYEHLEYTTYEEKFKVTCPIHGDFKKTYSAFLMRKQGCPKCSRKNRGRSINTEKFIKRVKKIYGDNKYDLSNIIYENSKQEMKIYCFTCEKYFTRTPKDLLQGYGCQNCKDFHPEVRKTRKERFYEKADEVLKFKNITIVGNYEKGNVGIKLKCGVCGNTFDKRPDKLLSGEGCLYCSKKNKKTNEEFINEVIEMYGEGIFSFKKTKYENIKKSVIITCLKHGDFEVIPKDFLAGRNGCKECNRLQSKGEMVIAKYLKDNKIKNSCNKTFDDLKDKSLLSYDFYLPDYNLLIEYNGIQHYEFTPFLHETEFDFHRQKHHDWLKRKYAKDHEIQLLIIPYWEFKNINNILKENII